MASKETEIKEDDFLKIKEVLKFVWESPFSSFYRDKYKKAGVDPIRDINTIEDFKKLPLLTKAEILAVPPYERTYSPKSELGQVTISSGTSGGRVPLITFDKLHPTQIKTLLEEMVEEMVEVSMILYPVLAGQFRLLRDDAILKKAGILRILGDISDLPLTAQIASLVEIDAIQTNSTILYYFLPHLRAVYDLDRIKLIQLGGEYCSEHKAKLFRENFKKARIVFTFGGTGSGRLGYRCRHLDDKPPKFFHPVPEFYYEPSPDDPEELIITHLISPVSLPLIRYQTGDSVRMSDFYCPCGSKKLMEVFGKLDYDLARIHGTFIYASEMAKALEVVQFYLSSPDWRLHVFEENKDGDIKIKLVLQLVPNTIALSDEEGIKKRISDEVSRHLQLSSKSTLSDLVAKRVFLPLEIDFVDVFPFAPKQKHIISHLE